MSNVSITVYKWAGAWGPFKIRIPCGERTLTQDVILDTLETELAGVIPRLRFVIGLARGGNHC